MPHPATVLTYIGTSLRALAARINHLYAPTYALEIVQAGENALTVRSRDGEFVFNRRYGTLKKGERVLALFSAIDAIVVSHQVERDDRPETWTVKLVLKDRLLPLRIGKSTDEADASIAAARISTYTGKPARTAS